MSESFQLESIFFQAKSEKQPYPTWVLVVSFLLAVTSVIPMIVVAVLRMTGLLKFDSSQYTAPMRRTDTNASTHPMMVGLSRPLFWTNYFLFLGTLCYITMDKFDNGK